MRVIKKNNVERIHKCEWCKSLIGYFPEDVEHGWNDYIHCPVCKHNTDISIFDRKIKK